MTVRFSVDDGTWTQGRGYAKRPIVADEALRMPGTLVQEVRIQPGESVPAHKHQSCTEVFHGREGLGKMTIAGEVYQLGPGDTIVCSPGQVHDAKNLGDKSWRYVVFKTNVVPDDTTWLD